MFILFHCYAVFFYMSVSQFIYPLYLWCTFGLFLFFKIMNKTALKILAHVFCWTYALISSRTEIAGHRVDAWLDLADTAKLFSKTIIRTLPPAVLELSSCLTSLVLLIFKKFSSSGGCVVLSHCDFDLYFLGKLNTFWITFLRP